MKERRKARLGKALEWSDEDLDQMAEIKPDDIEAARTFWRAHAPRRYRNLLDAQQVEELNAGNATQ